MRDIHQILSQDAAVCNKHSYGKNILSDASIVIPPTHVFRTLDFTFGN